MSATGSPAPTGSSEASRTMTSTTERTPTAAHGGQVPLASPVAGSGLPRRIAPEALDRRAQRAGDLDGEVHRGGVVAALHGDDGLAAHVHQAGQALLGQAGPSAVLADARSRCAVGLRRADRAGWWRHQSSSP